MRDLYDKHIIIRIENSSFFCLHYFNYNVVDIL